VFKAEQTVHTRSINGAFETGGETRSRALLGTLTVGLPLVGVGLTLTIGSIDATDIFPSLPITILIAMAALAIVALTQTMPDVPVTARPLQAASLPGSSLEPVLGETPPVAARPEAQFGSPSPSGTPAGPDPGAHDLAAALLAAIPDAALLVDRTGLIVNANPTASDVLPRSRAGLLITQVCRSPDLVDVVERALASGRVVVQFEEWAPVRRKLLMTMTALKLPGGVGMPPEPALLAVVRDASELERLAQMRADFIANASHELRTPLASLHGFIETLQGPARDDPAARDRFLSIMATQSSRMTRLIDDMLSLSRVEMRSHVPPTGVVDIQDVAQFVVNSMEPLAAVFAASITLERLSEPAAVRGDRDELVQVIQNLVHNALKYGRPKGGHVTVKLARVSQGIRDRKRIQVAVVDDGPGIPAEHLPRLTERFYRVNPTLSRDRGGTGLGLAIVKNIIARHRGELAIHSEVGRGSTFTILFDELLRPT
jgi:two-component system phosphate regulon sensor histidine kinase PhoR